MFWKQLMAQFWLNQNSNLETGRLLYNNGYFLFRLTHSKNAAQTYFYHFFIRRLLMKMMHRLLIYGQILYYFSFTAL